MKEGKEALYEVGKMKVAVRILKIKESYGRKRYLVKPLVGRGETIVEKLKPLR